MTGETSRFSRLLLGRHLPSTACHPHDPGNLGRANDGRRVKICHVDAANPSHLQTRWAPPVHLAPHSAGELVGGRARLGEPLLSSPLLSQAFSIGSATFGALKKVDKWIRLSERHGQNGGRMGRNQKRATQTGGQCLPGQQHVTRGARGDPGRARLLLPGAHSPHTTAELDDAPAPIASAPSTLGASRRGQIHLPCSDNSQLFHTSVMRPCADDLLSLGRNCPIRENGHNDARFSGPGSKRANA